MVDNRPLLGGMARSFEDYRRGLKLSIFLRNRDFSYMGIADGGEFHHNSSFLDWDYCIAKS